MLERQVVAGVGFKSGRHSRGCRLGRLHGRCGLAVLRLAILRRLAELLSALALLTALVALAGLVLAALVALALAIRLAALPIRLARLRGSILTIRTAAEQLDIVRHHFGSVLLDSRLVGVRTGAETALHEDLRSFMYEFFCKVCGIAPSHDVVPFRILSSLTAAISVPFSGCKRKSCDFASSSAALVSIKVTYIRVSSNVTDQHNFIQTHISKI